MPHTRAGSSTSSAPSVAVVGAGPGGLATALILAAQGLRVTVYEAQPEIGGRSARLRAGPFSFDTGPTFFLMPYVLEEVFAFAGRTLTDEVTLHRLDPMYRLIFGGTSGKGMGGKGGPSDLPPGVSRTARGDLALDATQDIDAMAQRLGAINPRDGEAFPRFIAQNRTKLRLMEPILRREIRTPLDLLKCGPLPDMARVGAMLHPYWSVHDLLSRYFTDPHVRLAVCFQSKYLGMSPFDCPSLFTILPFIEYEYGVWHVTGGLNALMHAMARACTDLGVDVRTSSPVRRLHVRGGSGGDSGSTQAVRAVEVATPDGPATFEHDFVVVNADASWALKNLLPPEARARAGREYSEQHLDSRRYSCSTYMLYLGVHGGPDELSDLPHHTIYISGNYSGNIADISTTGKLSEDPSIYVCNPSRLDPTLAPEGHSSLYVLVPTANLRESGAAGVDWSRDAGVMRERALDQMERVMGFRDIRRRIVAEKQYTPDDWRGMNINFGATFNLAHNLGQMLHKRPQNKLRGFDNVYLAGGGTHPGSGLPTIFLSAQIAAKLLCADAGLPAPQPRQRTVGATRPVPQPVVV
jgi:phytoene desaturase